MSLAVDRLEATVKAMDDAVDGAVTLLGTLSGLIRDTAGDVTKVNALADELDAKKAALAKAITDNTPSAPPPTPAGATRKHP